MRKLLCYLFTVGLLTSSGCGYGQNLTRSKAQSLIQAKYTSPIGVEKNQIDLIFGGKCFSQPRNPCGPQDMEEDPGVAALIRLGYLTVSYSGDTSILSLTAEGQRYATGEGGGDSSFRVVQVWTMVENFGTITGIIQQPGSIQASVKYTVIRKLTPFGEHRTYNNSLNANQSGTIEKTATFTKYDDGWRIDPGF